MKLSRTLCRWIPTIGLEIHAQIASTCKIFSGGAARLRNVQPNSTIALFDVAIPGTLPVLNMECVRAGVLTAMALNAKINHVSYFDRKHYFYPDLPAGYQITQKRVPLAVAGVITVPMYNSPFDVHIKQLHLEQDSGKTIFGEETADGEKETLVDYNRAGMGLMEIVTEPDMESSAQAAAFVTELRRILRRLGTCDGNMQDGSLRVDANISVREAASNSLGTRTEVKNISGIRFLAKAIDYEINRHITILKSHGKVLEETRSFNMKRGITISLRGKSDYEDYRFMAEHDLPPLTLYSNAHLPPFEDGPFINIDKVAKEMTELPSQQRARLREKYNLSETQANMLLDEEGAIEYFEDTMKHVSGSMRPDMVHVWITSDLYCLLEKRKLQVKQCPVSSSQLASLLSELSERKITKPVVKEVLGRMMNGDSRLAVPIIEELGLFSVSKEEIEILCNEVLNDNKAQVERYLSGEVKMVGYFIGQVLKKISGKGDGQVVRTILTDKLKQLK